MICFMIPKLKNIYLQEQIPFLPQKSPVTNIFVSQGRVLVHYQGWSDCSWLLPMSVTALENDTALRNQKSVDGFRNEKCSEPLHAFQVSVCLIANYKYILQSIELNDNTTLVYTVLSPDFITASFLGSYTKTQSQAFFIC